jgi:hypothetical protein
MNVNEAGRFRCMDRLIDLMLRVQAGPIPRPCVLAREYRCHRRTIYRLLASIERRVPVKRKLH